MTNFYKYNRFVENYTVRYLSNKCIFSTTNQFPKINSLTIQVYYNPYRYEYPNSYINDFIFVWYKHTQSLFGRMKNFKLFNKIVATLKFNDIKKYTLNQKYYSTENYFAVLKTLNLLIKKNTIKDTLLSTTNMFMSNKKNKLITYNTTNHNNFFLVLKKINFEQLTKGYNFILNPIDFYTDFKINLYIKNSNIYSHHTAWLLNLININYFFTATKHKYKQYSR